jgi:ribosome-binding protein aMBF1 (putative translation factor)
MGLSQEDLGRKINEKPSVISHLETGSMKPSDALARKLEHALKIELFLPPEDSFASEAETGPAGESGEPIQSV